MGGVNGVAVNNGGGTGVNTEVRVWVAIGVGNTAVGSTLVAVAGKGTGVAVMLVGRVALGSTWAGVTDGTWVGGRSVGRAGTAVADGGTVVADGGTVVADGGTSVTVGGTGVREGRTGGTGVRVGRLDGWVGGTAVSSATALRQTIRGPVSQPDALSRSGDSGSVAQRSQGTALGPSRAMLM